MKPILAVTVGDPAGIGPEIAIKAMNHPEIYTICTPLLIGDAPVLQKAMKFCGLKLKLHQVTEPEECAGTYGIIDYLETGAMKNDLYSMGQVSDLCGNAGFSYVVKGIELALAKKVRAVVTGPINKEALNLAGHHFSGHTEIFAQYTHTPSYAMMLVSKSLRVIHVTTHVSMRDACNLITKDRVLNIIRLASETLKELGLSDAVIAVAGLNAHCSENGLFGNEENDAIIPAVLEAEAEGIRVEGPIPADTVFIKAMSGKYAMVVCMYHDQGHIPLKMSGFEFNSRTGEFTSVSGVNCTVGLPIIRTSVDHGTAFDRAGNGSAKEESLIDSIKMAVTMALHRFSNKE